MTLAATRRYAFGASVVLGLAATLVAVALISVLLGSPERIIAAMTDTDLSSLFHVVLDRIGAAVRAVLRLL